MNIVIFNEYIHEKKDDIVKSVYPEGIHAVLAEILKGHTVRCITLDNIDELSQRFWQRQTFCCGGDMLGTIWCRRASRRGAAGGTARHGLGLLFIRRIIPSRSSCLWAPPAISRGVKMGTGSVFGSVTQLHPIANGLDLLF